MPEQTTYQLNNRITVVQDFNADIIVDSEQTSSWYEKVRKIRRDPTISLVRQMFVAPALTVGWRYLAKKNAPKNALEEIKEQIEPFRSMLVRKGMLGCADFGWMPFEKIFTQDENGTRIKKLKCLLHDITFIQIVESNGAFDGFKQDFLDNKEEQLISLDKSLLYYYDVEGTNWYGESFSKNVETIYDFSKSANESADRFDRKIAGAHWLIHYPPGKSEYEGTEQDNYDIAKKLAGQLQASGLLIIPRQVEQFIDRLNNKNNLIQEEAWKIELISVEGEATFEDRLRYYDSLKSRGFGLPERSILEGQYGTKAEAGEHGDFALMYIALRHDDIISLTNWHLVNQLLRENYGDDAENSIYIEANPLGDQQRTVLKSLYDRIITNSDVMLEEISKFDMSAFYDALGIPVDEDKRNENNIPVLIEERKKRQEMQLEQKTFGNPPATKGQEPSDKQKKFNEEKSGKAQ